ncbi:class I SAM-dependent methyltransferase [Larkinella humicola]|uniref:Methyltransferase domain-containing protein n=1 Tax=Larkinella humicola TaxID=2607654 RepID=A0A5N1JNX6_9BACT|nr:class I SAM-dependent methyltransferase [Larkinella humicola]KAA9357326.1 methyltransferase domain-containing protein [Larkinella humicola]
MWYENFFYGLVQEAWKAGQTDEQTELECDFLHDTLDVQPGGRVLDIFCGHGRHALELARMGYSVTGVDISTESIGELRKDANREKLTVEAIAGDFMTLPIEGSFEAAYCLGNSFSFFPHDQMLVFLQKIAALLPAGGRFVADTAMIAESVLPDFEERNWMQIGEITFLMENEYDAREGCITSHLTYLRDGQKEYRQSRHYIYTVAELHRLFQKAGLTITELLGNLDGSDFLLGDERLLLVASKSEEAE